MDLEHDLVEGMKYCFFSEPIPYVMQSLTGYLKRFQTMPNCFFNRKQHEHNLNQITQDLILDPKMRSNCFGFYSHNMTQKISLDYAPILRVMAESGRIKSLALNTSSSHNKKRMTRRSARK